MKKLVFVSLASFFCCIAFAQNLVVHHNDKGLYTVHTVAPKENFYSLGRLFNTPPKDIAAFNSLEMEHGLSIGQTVNIPLTASNFSQDKANGNPVYYVVGDKEGLYRVSVKNNKVLMANLRRWNDLKTDIISSGQKLIVGYLVSTEYSSLANTNMAVVEKKEPVKQPEEKKAAVVEDEQKPIQKKIVEERKPDLVKNVSIQVSDVNGGYFKPAFEQQPKSQQKKEEMATAGIFKTASGWQDSKYYALIDGVEPGTIIRIVNPANNKAIYAKVLDKMTGIRQNQGYTVRISNAAATALDIADTDKFVVRVTY